MIKGTEKRPGHKDSEIVFFTCNCGSEVLRVEKLDSNWGLFYLQMYQCTGLNFWGRIKLAWKYFCYGELHGNDMVIEKEDLKGLVEFLESTKELLEEEGK